MARRSEQKEGNKDQEFKAYLQAGIQGKNLKAADLKEYNPDNLKEHLEVREPKEEPKGTLEEHLTERPGQLGR